MDEARQGLARLGWRQAHRALTGHRANLQGDNNEFSHGFCPGSRQPAGATKKRLCACWQRQCRHPSPASSARDRFAGQSPRGIDPCHRPGLWRAARRVLPDERRTGCTGFTEICPRSLAGLDARRAPRGVFALRPTRCQGVGDVPGQRHGGHTRHLERSAVYPVQPTGIGPGGRQSGDSQAFRSAAAYC